MTVRLYSLETPYRRYSMAGVFFGGKGTSFYSHNGFFWIKMTLFAVQLTSGPRLNAGALWRKGDGRNGAGRPVAYLSLDLDAR